MTVIPGLPDELAAVPPAPISPDDPERDAKRLAWVAWRERVIRDNDRHHATIERDGAPAIADELIACANHPAYWLARWGHIFEPRTRGGRGGEGPFIPFAKQVDLLDFWLWTLEQDGPAGDAATSKSRDVGASWMLCAFALWGCLFRSPWQVRLMSYKEALVDEGYQKHPDSLFWKIDYLMDRLPRWMIPRGFTTTKHRHVLYLANPQNGNVIGGMSSTARSGRAGRATWIGFDEFAMFEDGDDSASAAKNTTDHCLFVSSEHIEYGDHFQRLQRGGDTGTTISLMPVNWWDHPYHDDTWYEEMKARFDAEGNLPAFYREVGRDVYAGSKTWVYEIAKTRKIDPEARYSPGAPLYGSIDPGKRDQCALIWAADDPQTGELIILDGYTTNGPAADYYATLINGVAKSGDWTYDDEALRVMAWTSHLPAATWFGDHSGDNKEAATGDAVYNRLRMAGIYVNADRTPSGEVTAAKNEVRHFKGRKEAALEYLPRTRFADTPGARKVLWALQQARYKPEEGKTTIEAGEPMHDATSHFRTAYEYLCAHLKMRRNVGMQPLPAAKRPSRYRGTQIARWSTEDRTPLSLSDYRRVG